MNMPEKKDLSFAFDLPTQMGYDSDHPFSEGRVGRTGIPIDSIEDLQPLFNGVRLEEVSTSMAINATGYILLAFYAALAKQQGADLKKLDGTIQNDILKEYAVRGNYIYPPKHSMRIITDIFEWCSDTLPKWNTISISDYHTRESDSTAVQEIALTLSNGKAYVKAAMEKGLDINVVGKRLSFFFNAHNNPFEEGTKFRAARRIWGIMMKELGATDPEAIMLRRHTQPGGGIQSLQTNGHDEALSLPIEEAAWSLIHRIDEMGGSVSAIEQGFIQEEIARSAFEYRQPAGRTDQIIDDSDRQVQDDSIRQAQDDSIRRVQTEKLNALKRRRDPGRIDSILQDLNDKAASDENIMPVVVEAAGNLCTLGEIADTLREVFGEYK
jgi:methylmalonyl-CoA mutase N-terminal domain/subunit